MSIISYAWLGSASQLIALFVAVLEEPQVFYGIIVGVLHCILKRVTHQLRALFKEDAVRG